MVSFNVVFLFTNVPLEETINMIGNYIYKENNPSPPAFEKDVFVKLMRLATQRLFLYKDTLYKQIDGVTMGCSLEPDCPHRKFLYGSNGKSTIMQ